MTDGVCAARGGWAGALLLAGGARGLGFPAAAGCASSSWWRGH